MTRARKIACLALLVLDGMVAFGAALPKGDWDETVHAALQAMLDRHEGDVDAYAVFDFDMTCAIGDCGHCTIDRLVKDIAFAFKPEEAEKIFFEGVPDLDRPLHPDFPKATVRNLVTDCAELHRELLEMSNVHSMEDVRKSSACAALASKVRFLRKRMPRTFGDEFGYPWNKRFFTGMARADLADLVHRALDEGAKTGFRRCIWRTPAEKAGRAGVVEVQMLSGFVVPQEMKDLLGVLRKSGIAAYVLSGSFYDKVLPAAEPRHGAGFDADKVYAIHIETNACGQFVGRLDKRFPMPWKTGKSNVVRQQIAGFHHGKEPILVVGDANGDYAMLTAFEKMEVGLIFDTQPDPQSDLGKLNAAIVAGKADRRFMLQGRDEAKGKLRRSSVSLLSPVTICE